MAYFYRIQKKAYSLGRAVQLGPDTGLALPLVCGLGALGLNLSVQVADGTASGLLGRSGGGGGLGRCGLDDDLWWMSQCMTLRKYRKSTMPKTGISMNRPF